MKRFTISVLLFGAFLLNSCAQQNQEANVAQQNVEVIRGMYDSFAKGDIPPVLEAMHPKVEWSEAEGNPYADGNPYIGPQAVLEGVFMRLGNEWEYWKLSDIEMVGAITGEVVSTGRYKAKHKKTGKELDAQFVHKFWLQDGKVVKFQQYMDTHQIVEAMREDT
jgi:ketosteroid isomerase-like protein